MFESNASLRYRFRGHRARSCELTGAELIEVRAAQRTFEGAYVRTALGQFGFSLVVLKVFTREFYPIGALFSALGCGLLAAAALRRREGNRQFFRDGARRKFRTSGNVVTLVTCISVTAYAVLLVLILRLI